MKKIFLEDCFLISFILLFLFLCWYEVLEYSSSDSSLSPQGLLLDVLLFAFWSCFLFYLGDFETSCTVIFAVLIHDDCNSQNGDFLFLLLRHIGEQVTDSGLSLKQEMD